MNRLTNRAAVHAILLLAIAASPAASQSAPLPSWADSAVLIAPGPQYARGVGVALGGMGVAGGGPGVFVGGAAVMVRVGVAV